MQPVADSADFVKLCEHIRAAGLVAFDTEFVSDATYQPALGLLQFATADECVAVDPLAIDDLSPWWELMGDETVTVVVHGGQAEIRFCLTLGKCRPQNLVDIQLAEGVRSRSYPLSYSALVRRVVGRKVHGGQTRTDWRRRPLADEQVRYACEDVEHVLPVWKRQRDSLKSLGRLEWAQAEFDRMVSDIEAEFTRPSWDRLPGLHKLSRRQLAIAQLLSDWREEQAVRSDRSPRRVLRDDLLIDLARRQPKTASQITSNRDMNRPAFRKHSQDLLQCIQRGLDLSEDQLPSAADRPLQSKQDDEHIVSQLLSLALANRCAELDISKQLVGTNAELRQLVRWHQSGETGSRPLLAQGWRTEVCGELLTEVLDGRIALRVADPDSDHPLLFERDARD